MLDEDQIGGKKMTLIRKKKLLNLRWTAQESSILGFAVTKNAQSTISQIFMISMS